MPSGDTENMKSAALRLSDYRFEEEDDDIALLNEELIGDLREEVGDYAFDELYEDAVFEVTERLGALDLALAAEDHDKAGRLATELAAAARQAGFAQVATVAETFAGCCGGDDTVAISAIGERLLRVGEESLLRSAR